MGGASQTASELVARRSSRGERSPVPLDGGSWPDRTNYGHRVQVRHRNMMVDQEGCGLQRQTDPYRPGANSESEATCCSVSRSGAAGPCGKIRAASQSAFRTLVARPTFT